jgi:Bacterial SH3 domain
VIAFISCSGGTCRISYPRPSEVYSTYEQCRGDLPDNSSDFDASEMKGSEITCLAISDKVAMADKVIWTAIGTTNVRKGPSVNEDVLGEITRGESFAVLGTHGNWLEVWLGDGSVGYFWAARAVPADEWPARILSGSSTPPNR